MIEPTPRRRLYAHLIFWPLLAFWTWELCHPNPVPTEIRDLLFMDWMKVAAAKCLHLTGYAFLIFTVGYTLPPRRDVKRLVLSLMMFHGVLTEVIQTIVPNRSGRAYDVAIDWTGLCLGMLVGWRIWRQVWRGPTDKNGDR